VRSLSNSGRFLPYKSPVYFFLAQSKLYANANTKPSEADGDRRLACEKSRRILFGHSSNASDTRSYDQQAAAAAVANVAATLLMSTGGQLQQHSASSVAHIQLFVSAVLRGD